MPITPCPECGYELAEATSREKREGEVFYRFACSDCGHEWLKEI